MHLWIMCSESLYYPLVILRITYFFVFIYLRTWPVFALSFFVTHPMLYTHWWKKPGKDCGPSDFTCPFVGQSQEFGAPVLLLYESKSRTPVALIFFKYVGSSASGICPVLTQICPLGLASPISFFYILNVFLMSRWSAVSVLAVMWTPPPPSSPTPPPNL